VKLLSLSAAIHMLPPGASQPVAVIAIWGTTEPGDERFVRVEAVAAVPVRGGLLRFSQPLKVVLAAHVVAAIQAAELPAEPAAK
jgi:hypothetical protein